MCIRDRLYNLRDDPEERNDLAGNPKSALVLQAMRNRWEELRKKAE